jgi:uncharacterized membrane protein required for colicin V production
VVARPAGRGATPQPAEPPRKVRAPAYLHAFRAALYLGLVLLAALGGSIGRAVTLLGLPLAILGDWEGGTRHSLRAVALLLVIWLVSLFGSSGATLLSGKLPVGLIVGIVVLCIASFIAVGFLSRRLARSIRRRPHLGAVDRMAGGLMGACEGGLIVALVCWTLGAFDPPMRALRQRLEAGELETPATTLLDTFQGVTTAAQGDALGRWLLRHNPIGGLELVQTARLFTELSVDQDRVLRAVDDGRLDYLAELPEVRKYVDAVEGDPSLRAAIAQGDGRAVLNSPIFQEMLRDPALHRALLAHREDILRAIGHPVGGEP